MTKKRAELLRVLGLFLLFVEETKILGEKRRGVGFLSKFLSDVELSSTSPISSLTF